jgi:membrane protease YdiL (CAAX protease family)
MVGDAVDSLTQTQIIVLAAEVAFVAAGIVAWFFKSRRDERPGLVWDASVTDTLFLAWAILFGAFLGQLSGVLLLRMLPEVVGSKEATQLLVSGMCFDGACIATWLGVHHFMRVKGQALPAASDGPVRIVATFGSASVVFIRALPVVAVVGLAASYLLETLDLPVEQQDIVGVFARAGSPFSIAGLLVLAVVMAPIAEELVFRAGIFRVLKGRIGRWPAIAISSALFALLHGSLAGFAGLFCLGVAFCLSYERTRNIAVPMVAHGLFNLNSIVVILALPPEMLQ